MRSIAGHRMPSQALWALMAAFLAAGALLAAFFFWHHAPGQSRWLPPCMFYSATGLLCPGCGITRALHALAHGHLVLAFSMNAMAMTGLLAGTIELADRIAGQPGWWARPRALLHDARIWCAFILVFVIARNLPWFSFLAPGAPLAS